jgi:CDP-glycerol glycerophosphotransferase
MPLFSIVVPAYGVAGYLRECLDSILHQSFTDLEVIAVDDRSPDNCGEILDEYAHRDPRVTVVHLEQNVGLGLARNAGLDRARGEYVWFVDSDDWLAPGSLSAVARRLRETEPEVLLVDHAQVWMSGRTALSGLGKVLPRASTPDTFTAAELPTVLKPLHTVWGKVIRHDVLLRIGLRFAPGWYEDVSFTFPLLLAAQRISVLHRLCYYYRQRRHSAITGTRNKRHFEVFDQYERLYQILDEWQLDLGPLRPVMFDQMLYHYDTIVSRDARLPRQLRREFFARMLEHYRRYLPPEPAAPASTVDERRRREIARGSWRLFYGLHRARAAVRKVRRRGRSVAATGWALVRRVLLAIRWRMFQVYYRAQRHLPMDEHLAIFSAYWGRGYLCNPAAVYEKAKQLAPHVHGVWMVAKGRVADLPPGVDYVVKGSLPYYRALARAKYFVENTNFPNFLRKRPGSVHLQTHHGTPLKVMGMEHYRFPIGARGMDLPDLLRRCDRWDFSISTGSFNTEVWQRAYPCRHETLEVGYPRNDRLCTATPADVAAVRSALGLAPDETVVLFAPTHRDYQPDYEPLDVGELADALGPQVRVLARLHHFHAGRPPGEHPQVLDVSAYPRVEDLYLAADVLITDYSSVMFDFGHLDRPIVIFVPDWDAYRRTRGITFDLMAEPPGVVATTLPDLVDAFRSGAVWGDRAEKARADFRRRFCRYGDGRASERVVRRVFLGERLEPGDGRDAFAPGLGASAPDPGLGRGASAPAQRRASSAVTSPAAASAAENG